MTVIASGLPCTACIADDLPLGNTLPGFHSIALQVGIQSAPAVTLAVRAVVNDHKVAPAVMLGSLHDNTVSRSQYIGAGICAQIITTMAVVLKAGDILVIRYRIDKQRAVVGVLQQRQLAGGGRDNLRGSCRGRGFLRLGCFRCCGGLPRWRGYPAKWAASCRPSCWRRLPRRKGPWPRPPGGGNAADARCGS